MAARTRILLISGSLRARSSNSALLRTALAVAPAGVEATTYDGLGGLPHCRARSRTCSTGPSAGARRTACRSAGSTSPGRGRGAAAHASLRSVLTYTGTDIVDAAVIRIPVARDAVGSDGLIGDPAIREAASTALTALAARVATRAAD